MAGRIDFSEIPKDRGYDSAFESDVEKNEKRQSYKGLVPEKRKREKLPNKRQVEEELIREEGKVHRFHAVAKDAFSRHKEYINNYLLYYGGKAQDFERDTSNDRTDLDVIRDNHKFLWDENEDETNSSWEKQLAKKYYDKLFKEYCIADLSRYKENKIGMRWRIEKEVISGKGQFMCGNKKCSESQGLRSWEVNFGYVEHGEKKNALVKLRLCPDCSYKLNYHHKRKEVVAKKSKKDSSTKSRSKKSKKQRRDEDLERGESSKMPSHSAEGKKDADGKANDDDDDDEVWKKPVVLTEEKSREDEFDDYFADMFL